MTDIIAQAIRQAVRRPEVIEAMCASLEQQLARELSGLAGGSEVYVGKRPDKSQRDARVRAKFNGSNYTQLAKDERLSTRQVRRIIHGPPEKK